MNLRRIRHARYIAFLVLLAIATPVAFAFLPADYALGAGFDFAAAFFIVSALTHWRDGEPDTIRKQALRDAEGRHMLLLFTVIILFSVMTMIGTLVMRKGDLTVPGFLFVVGTLATAWTFANLVYAFHYASLYYDSDIDGGDRRGLEFPGTSPPCFADFVNFSFVLGMTSQTADIAITGRDIRRAATLHGLTAYVFNLGVLAMTINLMATTL